ncbi:MAG: LacI family DNA-binding transcriptional regulator [Oscillospiraceae bacterium]
MITSKEIARRAGVSRGTVDRVLNNRPGVKPSTRERVEEIIRELEYVPNRAGKALSSSRRPIEVGIILNRGENQFYDEIIAGIEDCRERYGDFQINLQYRFLSGYEVEQQVEAIRSFSGSDISFLIVTPISDPAVAEALNEVIGEGIPVITLNSDIKGTGRLLHVGCDYFASGRTAAGLLGLFSHGKGAVGIVTGSHRMLGHNQRVEGFLSELAIRFPGIRHVDTVESFDNDDQAEQSVAEMLGKHPEIDLLYFAAAGASGGLRAVRSDNGSNPRIAVTCDDFPDIRQLLRAGQVAATVCQEPFRQGSEALGGGLQYLLSGQRPASDVLWMRNEIKIAQNLD